MPESAVLTARVRECWVLAANPRLSAERPDYWGGQPAIHTLAVEWIRVSPEHRRQGHCRRFLEELCRDPAFDMVVVEMAQNAHLQEALSRWGWACDKAVRDYRFIRHQETAHAGEPPSVSGP